MGRRGSDGGRARPRRWWDELAYRAAQGSFSTKGTFILRKLADHDAAKLQDVLADVLPRRRAGPGGHDEVRVVILRFLGAHPDEIADVQRRMGRVWR